MATKLRKTDGKFIKANEILNLCGVVEAADAAERLALKGLPRGARVLQADDGTIYELKEAANPDNAASWAALLKTCATSAEFWELTAGELGIFYDENEQETSAKVTIGNQFVSLSLDRVGGVNVGAALHLTNPETEEIVRITLWNDDDPSNMQLEIEAYNAVSILTSVLKIWSTVQFVDYNDGSPFIKFLTSGDNNTTALHVGINGAFVPVTIGANDSGGAGKRALVVPNI